MRHIFKLFVGTAALAVFFSGNASLRGASVLSYHNDGISSGVNSLETVLTPANLTVGAFSKRYAAGVDGQIYAQPLYVPSVVVTGGAHAGTHNLAIVATQHDSLYAIDADSGAVVWKTSFLTSGLPGATSITSVPSTDTGTMDTAPEIGVCGTPVIDPATNLLYVAAKTKQILNGVTATPNYVYTLYQIDITNGNATSNANIVNSTVIGDTTYDGTTYTYRTDTDPTAAQDPFVVGTGDGAITVNSQSRVYFNALREMNRPGLILAGGSVYIAFGSHGDMSPYHGWMLGFDKNTLAVTAVLNLTPNGGLGGIWSSGGIPTVDANGDFYVMTGNGTFDGYDNNGATAGLDSQGFPVNGNYGDCFVRISADPTTSVGNQNKNGWGLMVADYFAPFNNQTLSENDTDLGSGGCTLLPDSAGNVAHPHLLVGAGKQGNIYLIDRDSMGKFTATTDNVVQSQVAIGGSFDTPAFFNGHLYFVGEPDNGKAFTIANAAMSTSPVQTPDNFGWPGSTPSISANGTANGVVWTIDRDSAQLRAYSADNFNTEIWTSALAPGNRDQLGTPSKFATPTIADGRVLVGTTTALVVYAVTPTGQITPPTITTSLPTGIAASSATLNGVTNPNGSATTVSFQYGTTTAYGKTTSGQSAGSGTANVSFSTGISELAPQTVYHYQAVATNAGGTVLGADTTLTTAAAAASPDVYLGASGAEVVTSVNPGGTSTSAYFQYGTTTGYGSQTTPKSVGRGRAAVTVYGLFPELNANTTYHYRLVTTSAAGTSYGPDETLTTLPFDTTLVAQKGDSAAEVSGATFASFGNPAVNVNDGVAFAGTLTSALGGVTRYTNFGIWADDNSATRQLVTRIGNSAPGTSGTFSALSDPVYNNSDAVAFRGSLKLVAGQATRLTSAGIWSTSSGSLALVARQGSHAPGCPPEATFAGFTSLGLSDSGGTVLLATLNPSSAAAVTRANDVGIWKGNSTADLALVLRLGDIVGGKTITGLTFLPKKTYVNGQTRGFASTSGDIVCEATFSDKTSGVVEVVRGTPQIAVVSGSPADGAVGTTFASFGSPAINTNDHTAFAATLTNAVGGVTRTNNAGIWADDPGGARQLIARVGSGAAPGTAANFLTLSDPVYNNNEAVAFRATLNIARSQAAAIGIWCNSAGPLALVAQQGNQAPGCPTGATFSNFTELALADQGGATNQGGVIVLATLKTNGAAGVGRTNDLGIWAVDTTGTLQLIVRTGDILNGKTVTGLAFLPAPSYVNGQSRSFAQGNGDIVYLATFSDRSTAIFNVVFP